MTGQRLDREELIEQAYFFRVYRERLLENAPSQEILAHLQEEILSTTRLPVALEFLQGEMLMHGRMSEGMSKLPHYFTAFQTFVMARAEEEKSRFDQRIALEILEREAEYLADAPRQPALFVFQFECVARNRLGYDRGLQAMADSPLFNDEWRDWILRLRYRLGTTDFCDLIWMASAWRTMEHRRRTGNEGWVSPEPELFGEQEGRIARASRGRDPLYLFAALQRQLSYPVVPRSKPVSAGPVIHPVLEQRLQRLEQRLKLLELEQKGGLDLQQFAVQFSEGNLPATDLPETMPPGLNLPDPTSFGPELTGPQPPESSSSRNQGPVQ